MPAANELVRYRGIGVGRRDGGGSYPIATDSSSNSNGGGEDWITKKRVETKTTRNVEKRVQRQVVLEDGRIIEEGDPHVTVDVTEDAQSHSDDGNEDRRVVGGGGWRPNGTAGDLLGENRRRNVFTKDVRERCRSTTAAFNLGDITSKDVNKIVRDGRSSKTFIRPYEGGAAAVAPAVTRNSSSRNRTVDTEDVEEVRRLGGDGKVETEKRVTRECVEDANDETPSDGGSVDTEESRDGDRDSFSQRKEERFVDYYSVPRGRSVKDGKLLRHGVHLTSHDRSGGPMAAPVARAIPYEEDWWSKPPSGGKQRQTSSSDRDSSARNGPARHPKFATIERSNRTDKVKYGSGGYGFGPDRRRRSETRSDHSDSSQGFQAAAAVPRRGNLKHRYRSTGTLHVEEPRRGVARARSFASHDYVRPQSSLFGSFKSLYASLTRPGGSKTKKKEEEDKVSAANRVWFDRGDGKRPKAPPRKARSTTSAASSFDLRDTNGNGRHWEMYSSTSTNLRMPPPPPRKHSPSPRRSLPSPRRSPPPAPPAPPAPPPPLATSLAKAAASSARNRERREPRRFEEDRHRRGQVRSRFFGQQEDSDLEEGGGGGRHHHRPPPDMRRLLLNNVNVTRSQSMSKDLDRQGRSVIHVA